MELRDDPALAEFRAETHAWLSENLPAGWGPTSQIESWTQRWELFGRGWEQQLHAAGLNGVSWPLEVGGRGKSLAYEIVVLEELATANVPESINNIAKSMLGPTLLIHGRVDQQQAYMPGILDGSRVWCQGFSEPGAGSDLANVQARGERVDGGYRLFGQKIWTSFAQGADWMFAVVRTEAGSERHRGLSFMLFDLRQTGIDVRPIRQMDGAAEFNEVFFDGAWVSEDCLVGEPGNGWQVAMTMLGCERGLGHVGRYIRFRRELEQLIEFARALDVNGRSAAEVYEDRLMAIWTEIEIYRLSAYRLLSEMEGRSPGAEASIVKVFWTEMLQRMEALAVEIIGQLGILTSGSPVPRAHAWMTRYLNSLSRTIAGGTSEIQRNIIAERLLGLPR